MATRVVGGSVRRADCGGGATGGYISRPSDAIAALGRLGFSTDDSDGNFRIWFDVPDPPDFNRIADFILKALHDGYGARASDDLEFNAPLAPHATSKCIPVS